MKNLKVISIGTLKGGVGKSSITFNVAGILAERKNKVLVIDLDPQANTTSNFGISKNSLKEANTSINMFIDQINPMLIVQKNKIKGLSGLDLIPSSILLTRTEMQLVSSPGREKLLWNYFKQYYEWFNEYDYIIIDTNPSMSIVNQNAFVMADEILLVTESAVNSFDGAEEFISLWNDITSAIDMKNNLSGIIVNKVEKNEKSTKEFLQFIESNQENEIGKLFFKTYIPKNVDIKDANQLENVPINIYKKSSSGYKAINKLVDELIERGVVYE